MDYKNYLAQGLDAAKKARDNKREIHALIDTLSNEIKEFSDGKVVLKITNEQKLSKNHNNISATISSLTGLNPWVDYQALALYRITKDDGNYNKKTIIANWAMDESDGYPCIISYNKQDVNCSNKQTLERALGGLLRDAATGEKLLNLMDADDS